MSVLRTIRTSIRQRRADSRLFNHVAFTLTPTGALWIITWLSSDWNGRDAIGGFIATLLAGTLIVWPGRHLPFRLSLAGRVTTMGGWMTMGAALLVISRWFELSLTGVVALTTLAMAGVLADVLTTPQRGSSSHSSNFIGRNAPQARNLPDPSVSSRESADEAPR